MSYYVTNENSFLDIKNAHLRVTGNVHTDVLKVGSIGFQPAGSNISGTVNFTNVTTGVTTTSNLNVGGTLNLGTIELSASTHTLDHITARGNVTSTTVQFDNAHTSLVTSGNVEIGGELTVSGGVVSNVNLLSVSNVASIKKDSNVVTEFPRSKKLIKYPRVVIASGQSGLSGGYTQDNYNIQVSSEWDSPSLTYAATYAVDNTFNNDGWLSGMNTYSSDGTAANATSPDTFQEINGSWINIQLPDKIVLDRFTIINRDSSALRNADSGILWAKNKTDSTWIRIHDFSDLNPASFVTNTIHTNQVVAYDEYRLQITKMEPYTVGTPGLSIGEWQLFGVPEYDPEAHGTDVVVKSIPNVPNTDWLEVYYDGQDYTVDTDFAGPGGVIDKAGGDQDGTAGTGVGFDSTYKAFTFDGSATGKIEGTHGLGTGTGIQYSMSLWFKADVLSGNQRLATFGTQGTQYQSSALLIYQNNIHLDHWLSEIKTTSDILVPNVWYHLVAIHSGPGTEDVSQNALYLNGVKLENVTTGGSAANGTFNLQGLGLTIGADSAGTNPFDGSIANFRLFNRPLTPDEIWQLYAYQKEYFGHGDLGMTLKAGRLGIGTSEPRAMLDVRGDTFSTLYKGGRTTFLTWDYVGQRSTSFSAGSGTGGTPVDNTILDYTFTIPSCYHHLGRANLKAHVQIDWRGECEEPWNFGFRIEIRYNNDGTLVNSSVSDGSSTSGNKINGLPCISYDHSNFDSTPEAASITSTFALPNCDVSPGSTLKVSLVGRNGVNAARTVWTGRTKGFQTTSPAHELPTTSFFVVLDVDDGY